VDALLPGEPVLSGDASIVARREVSGFVCSQIAALPAHLRVPYRVALAAFELLPVVRHGRRFSRLDEARKARYLGLWSGAPIAAFRNFVKLIRSCALLAFFDHPLVMAAMRSHQAAASRAPESCLSWAANE
jgi:hypothetical protein